MDIYYLIVGFSMLASLVFAANIIWDILRTAWSKFKGSSYEWQTPGTFNEMNKWWKPILLLVVLVIGFYAIFASYGDGKVAEATAKYAEFENENNQLYTDIISCPYCGEDFPEEYSFVNDKGSAMCPLCTGNDLNILLDGEILRCWNCSSYYFPSDSNGFGLCWDCSTSQLGGCSNCGECTFQWDHSDDFTLCPRCAGSIYSDEQIQQAFDAYFE